MHSSRCSSESVFADMKIHVLPHLSCRFWYRDDLGLLGDLVDLAMTGVPEVLAVPGLNLEGLILVIILAKAVEWSSDMPCCFAVHLENLYNQNSICCIDHTVAVGSRLVSYSI